MSSATYAYAIVAAGAAPPACAGILPDAPVRVVRGGRIAVLASPVPRALFESGSGAARTADPAWMAERASAHHAVAVAAAAQGPALPLAFGALFSDEAALAGWAGRHADELDAALPAVADAAEWSLTLAEDAPAHAAWLAAHDPALAALARQAQAAGPGTAYLLGRRLSRAEAGARAARIAAIGQRLADLAATHARHVAPLAPRADRAAGFATLVGNAARPALAEAVAALGAELAGSGLAVALDGPWPAYAFARHVAAGWDSGE